MEGDWNDYHKLTVSSERKGAKSEIYFEAKIRKKKRKRREGNLSKRRLKENIGRSIQLEIWNKYSHFKSNNFKSAKEFFILEKSME